MEHLTIHGSLGGVPPGGPGSRGGGTSTVLAHAMVPDHILNNSYYYINFYFKDIKKNYKKFNLSNEYDFP